MMIVCPTCTTTYDVSAASLGPAGRSVRCVKCRTVWHADPIEVPAFAVAETATQQTGPPADDFRQMPQSRADEVEPWPGEDGTLTDPGVRALEMDRYEKLDEQAALDDHESPSIAPDDTPHPPIVDVETLAARRAQRRSQDRKRRIRPFLTLVILLLAGVLGGILGWRADIVRLFPQTGSLFATIGLPVNLRGLDFSDLASVHEVVDGVTVLVIEGKIGNPTQQPRDVPRIRLALLNAAGAEIYAWTTVPVKSVLPAGAVQTFRTRLASPPAEGRAIAVRFLNRRDAVSGMK